MILLTDAESGVSGRSVVAVFGGGLIGAAIVSVLREERRVIEERLAFDWSSPSLWRDQTRAIEERIGSVSGAGGVGSVQFLWSAGVAGFGTSADAAFRELDSFRMAVDLAARISDRLPGVTTRFSLISSAGGLFEGQRGVGAESRPKPLRPYGALKLAQENYLLGHPGAFRRNVYRLSSVYGRIHAGQRRGLVAEMIVNGVRHRVSRIVGRMPTLRDYVFVDDVARFVVRRFHESDAQEGVEFLASFKPSSILEIQRAIEGVLRRRIYVSFSLEAPNSEDTTFSDVLTPKNWSPSDLGSNIRRICAEAVSSGTVFAA